jgi:hypothetical protein
MCEMSSGLWSEADSRIPLKSHRGGRQMKRPAKNSSHLFQPEGWREIAALIFGCLFFGYILTSCSRPENKVEKFPVTVESSNTSQNNLVPVMDPNTDFSKFKHSNPTHARFPCALCHERKDNAATPKFSAHLPCAGCHTGQFSSNKNDICTICHTNSETGTMKTFPALKSFNVKFDHTRHTRLTNCAACHQSSRNGTAFSIPNGLAAHNSCFSCHSPEAESRGRKIDSCGTCHQPGTFSGRISDWAKAYEKTPFKHSSHNLNCASCHQIKTGAGRGNQVTAPVAAMHFAPKNVQSCASCHNNKRVFGGEDFSDCRRCHRGHTFKFS